MTRGWLVLLVVGVPLAIVAVCCLIPAKSDREE